MKRSNIKSLLLGFLIFIGWCGATILADRFSDTIQENHPTLSYTIDSFLGLGLLLGLVVAGMIAGRFGSLNPVLNGFILGLIVACSAVLLAWLTPGSIGLLYVGGFLWAPILTAGGGAINYAWK